jgi:hypothetical protein
MGNAGERTVSNSDSNVVVSANNAFDKYETFSGVSGIYNKISEKQVIGRRRLLQLFVAAGAATLAFNTGFSIGYAQTGDRSAPTDSSAPGVEHTGFGEDPVSKEAIQSREVALLPFKFVSNYAGRDSSGQLEDRANEYLRHLLAIAMGYEGGGLAYAARDINEKVTDQQNPKNNTPNNMTKLADFGRNGVAQVGLIAPDLSGCAIDNADSSRENCPPVDPRTPLSIIRGVRPVVTVDGRTIFSFNHGLVVGTPKELDPKDLGMLIQSIKLPRESIILSNRIVDSMNRRGEISSIEEFTDLVRDPNSEFNIEIKANAWADSLEAAKTLHDASPEWWTMTSSFAEFYRGYIDVYSGGRGEILKYTRAKSVV